MKKIKTTANFFWSNSDISLYEYAYLKSFLNNNFEVNVYSFQKLKLPKGASLKNAAQILHKKEMKKYLKAYLERRAKRLEAKKRDEMRRVMGL